MISQNITKLERQFLEAKAYFEEEDDSLARVAILRYLVEIGFLLDMYYHDTWTYFIDNN